MSARDELYELAAWGDDRTANQKIDAYRAEVLAEVKAEVVAWLVKKAREGTPIDQLASKVDRGAVRAFIGTAHYRDAMDTYRAQVLAEAADKLALEMAPEQPGAGPGFLLALRLAMRALRRMADDAAAGTKGGAR